MTVKYRVALIGTGRVAEHYLRLHNLGLTDFLEYTYCFDISNSKLARFSEKFDIQALTSLPELLKRDFDFAIVATPSGTHFEIAKEVLKAGRNVLIEKPACLRVDQITELQNLSNERKLVCKSIFQNRFNTAVEEAKRMLDGNLIGKITSFSLRLIWSRGQDYYQDGWHGTWSQDGGVTSQQAIHHIDCVNFLIGKPKKVHAYAQNSINVLEAEDTLVSVVQIEPNILGTFHFTTAARPCDLEASLLINGAINSIRISGIALNCLEVFDSETKKWKFKVLEEVESGYGYGHVKVFENFMDSGFVPTFPTLEDSKDAVIVVDSLYESLESANEVLVDRQESKSRLGI